MPDDFGPFYFTGWAPSERPQGCTRLQAQAVSEDLLLPYADRTFPRYYRDITGWGLGRVLCADLTGDGRKEMVVQQLCCTGGALTPYAIFRLDARKRWVMSYVQVRETAFQLRLRGRTVRAVTPAPYAGACTTRLRDRLIRWNGKRFGSRLSRPYRITVRGC